jgi:hypothetical protein
MLEAVLSFLALLAMDRPITRHEILNAKEDVLAERLGDHEPSFAAIWRLARQFTGKAVLGLPLGNVEASVTPNGAVILPYGNKRLWLQITDSKGEAFLNESARSPIRENAPVIMHSQMEERVRWTQILRFRDRGQGVGDLELELIVSNEGTKVVRVAPFLALSILETPANVWQDAKQTPVASKEQPEADSRGYHLSEGLKMSFDFLWPPLQKRTAGRDWVKGLQSLELKEIETGAIRKWTVWISAPGWGFEAGRSDYDLLWSTITKRECELQIPEPKLQGLAHNLISQLLITAVGDQMVYGAFPSAYDNGFFGPEEGWAIQALAE